jgi:hypothetical protein
LAGTVEFAQEAKENIKLNKIKWGLHCVPDFTLGF